MVEYTLDLDNIFSSLADPTRRDILRRVARTELSINEIAQPYDLTLAAVSKHLNVLQKAKLIIKRRRGKQQLVHADPLAFKIASDYLREYEALWDRRFDALEALLEKED